MQHELTIIAPNQSGFFAKIMMAVRRCGCQLNAQRREVNGEAQIIILMLSGADALVRALAEDIEAIGNTVKTSMTMHAEANYVERLSAMGSRSDSTPRSSFMNKLAKDHPNLADMVIQMEMAQSDEVAKEILADIGDRVGKREYARNYALGSPLKLQTALPRMVVPAIKQFVNATIEDKTLLIPACSFCNHDSAQKKMCGFLSGFISGLLRSAPTTATIKVNQTGCVLEGHTSCRFEVSQ